MVLIQLVACMWWYGEFGRDPCQMQVHALAQLFRGAPLGAVVVVLVTVETHTGNVLGHMFEAITLKPSDLFRAAYVKLATYNYK